MTKFILLTIGALLLLTVVVSIFQYFVINLLKRREEKGAD
jgi:hypothetical protein